MTSSSYTYRTVDLKSNAVLEDIDLQNVEFSIKLSDVGDLTGSLFVPESKRGLLLDRATLPGRTGLYVMRQGVPVWGGIIWKRAWAEEEAEFRISCGSWESYAYHVVQTKDKKYNNTDQLTIGRNLLPDENIQSQSGIEPPPTASSGRLRVRTMWGHERKSVGLELEQLANLQDGFDYKVESYINGDGSFGRRYVFGYPRLGRTASLNPGDNSLTFDYPGNLAPFDLTEDAESGAWTVYAIGAGEGTEMLLAQATDASYSAAGWPRLDGVYSNKDVSIPATLQAHANRRIVESRPPIDSWTFRLAADSDVKLEDINVGDSAVFRLSSRRWEESKQFIRRITHISVRPGGHGTIEEIEIGLSDERS